MKLCGLMTMLLISLTGCIPQPQAPEVTASPVTPTLTPEASASVATSLGNQPASVVSPTPLPQATASKVEAILTTSDASRQINVRATSSVTSKLLGYGSVGGRVQVLKQAISADGDAYVWYQVKFPRSGVQGWIREDFVRLRTNQIPSESPTPRK